MYKLSICIPTRNRPQSLLKTVAEVQQQIRELKREQDIEIVVADNTDQPQLFVDPSQILATNLRYEINDGNLGYARNINKLITMAAGEYVWLLSDDDILRPMAVERIFQALQDKGGQEINYLTFFSGAQRDGKILTENLHFSDCTQHYFARGKDFLVKYWRSILFVSVNIFHREKIAEFAGKFDLFEKVNDVFQNSLLSLSFIDKFGCVRVIPETLLIDSCEDKLYTPFQSVNIAVLSLVKLMCQLRELGVSRESLRVVQRDIDISILFNGLRFAIRRIETEDDFDYAAQYRKILSWKNLYMSTKIKTEVMFLLLKMPRAISKIIVKIIFGIKRKQDVYADFKDASREWYRRMKSKEIKVSY